MKTSTKIIIAFVIILILIGVGWIIGHKTSPGFQTVSQSSATGSVSLYKMDLEGSNFVVYGKNLVKIELWAIPNSTSKTPVTQDKHILLGQAHKMDTQEGLDRWILPVPTIPGTISQVYAKALDQGGAVVSMAYLSIPGDLKTFNKYLQTAAVGNTGR